MGEPLTYTVPEAAALLGISPWAYYEGIKRGELPAEKIGRRIVVPKRQIDDRLGLRSTPLNENPEERAYLEGYQAGFRDAKRQIQVALDGTNTRQPKAREIAG